jgi:adenylate kinase
MRVLMIAPPGAGKGTQGALIAAHFDIPHIATGERRLLSWSSSSSG